MTYDHVTVFHYNMDGCTEPGYFPDWTKIVTSAGDMVQNVFNNDEWDLSVEIRPVGSGAAWRRSPHQKFAGRGENGREGRKERKKRRKIRERRKGERKGEESNFGEKDVLGLWV